MKITESFLELSPAYGRDYKNAKAASADFLAGKDFRIEDFRYGGKLCSVADFLPGTRVNLRYSQLRKVTVVEVPR